MKQKGEIGLANTIFDGETKKLPEVKTMYVRCSDFFRFTNITEAEDVTYLWQVQTKTKWRWKNLLKVEGKDARVFEHTFEKGIDYRVTAHIKNDKGEQSSKVVIEIWADDLGEHTKGK